MEETLVLEATLEAIMAKVDLSDTLIVVTADHSHVMTLGGLATPRGNDILGMFVNLCRIFEITILNNKKYGFHKIPKPTIKFKRSRKNHF